MVRCIFAWLEFRLCSHSASYDHIYEDGDREGEQQKKAGTLWYGEEMVRRSGSGATANNGGVRVGRPGAKVYVLGKVRRYFLFSFQGVLLSFLFFLE
jgi:hypothetical protein